MLSAFLGKVDEFRSTTTLSGTLPACSFGVSERWGHSASLLSDGRVFIVGGVRPIPQSGGTQTWCKTTELFDSVTGDLYTASDFGVMRLAAGSLSWALAGEGMPKVEVSSLTLVPGGRRLYAATHGLSAWWLTLR